MSRSVVSKLSDDLASMPQVDLHLFLSVIFLSLMLRLLGASELVVTALFSCISMPVSYTFSYFTYGRRRFVEKKTRGWIDLRNESAALISAYATGFLVFAALSGSFDYTVYTLAFSATLLMRLILLATARRLLDAGVDIYNPIIVLMMSLSAAVPVLILFVVV